MTREQKLEQALEDIINSFEQAGCDGCGTVSTEVMNRACELLKLPLFDTSDDE